MIFLIYFSIASGAGVSTDGNVHLFATAASTHSNCFKKISEGERLVGYDVTRIVERSSIEGCQQECIIYKCTHFSFGHHEQGNGTGTCELTTDRQISRRQDSSFDLYESTEECSQGKPTGYEEEALSEIVAPRTCYRRVFTGKRLNEKFIRHSLPCNSLEACQHQCSIEKHFLCQGFNVRLDSARVGRGICELSQVSYDQLDELKDFNYDPEFLYYERVQSNASPNCGYSTSNRHPGTFSYDETDKENRGSDRGSPGGSHYGKNYQGSWSHGRGVENHDRSHDGGPYVSNNPSRGPVPPFRPNNQYLPSFYGNDDQRSHQGHEERGRSFYGEKSSQWASVYPSEEFSIVNGGFSGRPNRIPTYIIIDANVNERRYGDAGHHNLINKNYLPPKVDQNLPPKERSFSEPRYVLPPETDSKNNISEKPQNLGPEPENLPFPPRDGSVRPHVYPARPEDFPPKIFFTQAHSSGRGFSDLAAAVPYSNLPASSPHFAAREVCFQRAHPGYRLNPGSIRETYNAPTVLDCENMCTGSSFECTGYSFRYSVSASDIPNCLLTDFQSIARQSHLLPDRNCDVYSKMHTCLNAERESDAECFLKVISDRKIDSGKIVKGVRVNSIPDCELACLSSDAFTCRSFAFKFGPKIVGESGENCFLSNWPVAAMSPQDFVFSPHHEIYERGSYGHGCELDVGPVVIGPESPFSEYPLVISTSGGSWSAHETWRHYTVSGWPCKTGTECQLNSIAGFWSCEVEAGDKEHWDYCCMPKHSCGYSRGYKYPWCYVGEAGPEQWRPCSDHYYPEFNNRLQYAPVRNDNTHLDDSYNPPRNARPWSFGDLDNLGPPTSWPISYLHAEPPLNESFFWDEEKYYYHQPPHYYENYPSPYEAEKHNDESPSIKFKPCPHKFPYPKATVQKVDLANVSKTGDPVEQMLSEKMIAASKNHKYRDTISEFSSSSEISEKETAGNSTTPAFRESTSVPEPSEEKNKGINDANKPILNKSKEVIKTVEKILNKNLNDAI